MAILIAEGMQKKGIAILHKAKIKTFIPGDNYNKNEVDTIIVRSTFEINKNTVKEFSNLKIVAKLGTGLDNIDQTLCKRLRIKVINAPGMNSISTAEFIITQILNIYKNSYSIYENVRNRDFRRALYYGRELSGATVGILGYGNVGKNIALRIRPFVKKVYIFENNQKCSFQRENLYFADTVDRLLFGSDIIIFAIPLKGNEKIVNKNFLSKIKKNALLVNAARGGIIDEDALIGFLMANKHAFYYCDVLKKEPDYNKTPENQDYKNYLLELPNVLYTPHICGMTEESQTDISLKIAKEIIREKNKNYPEKVGNAKR